MVSPAKGPSLTGRWPQRAQFSQTSAGVSLRCKWQRTVPDRSTAAGLRACSGPEVVRSRAEAA